MSTSCGTATPQAELLVFSRHALRPHQVRPARRRIQGNPQSPLDVIGSPRSVVASACWAAMAMMPGQLAMGCKAKEGTGEQTGVVGAKKAMEKHKRTHTHKTCINSDHACDSLGSGPAASKSSIKQPMLTVYPLKHFFRVAIRYDHDLSTADVLDNASAVRAACDFFVASKCFQAFLNVVLANKHHRLHPGLALGVRHLMSLARQASCVKAMPRPKPCRIPRLDCLLHAH